MWKTKKQFPVIFLEGIRTVSIAALPVHIAEIGHGAGLSFFIKDICLIKYFTRIRDWIFSLLNIVALTGPPGNIIVYCFYN